MRKKIEKNEVIQAILCIFVFVNILLSLNFLFLGSYFKDNACMFYKMFNEKCDCSNYLNSEKISVQYEVPGFLIFESMFILISLAGTYLITKKTFGGKTEQILVFIILLIITFISFNYFIESYNKVFRYCFDFCKYTYIKSELNNTSNGSFDFANNFVDENRWYINFFERKYSGILARCYK